MHRCTYYPSPSPVSKTHIRLPSHCNRISQQISALPQPCFPFQNPNFSLLHKLIIIISVRQQDLSVQQYQDMQYQALGSCLSALLSNRKSESEKSCTIPTLRTATYLFPLFLNSCNQPVYAPSFLLLPFSRELNPDLVGSM